MPSPLTIGAGFAFNEDQSSIPNSSKLDKALPVSKPYWLQNPEAKTQDGIYIPI